MILGVRLSKYINKTQIIATVRNEFSHFSPPVSDSLYE